MNLNILNDFRHGVYGCFGKARDALFKPFGCANQRSKRPQLSRIVVLAVRVTRTWASLYEAMEDGRIDAFAPARSLSGLRAAA